MPEELTMPMLPSYPGYEKTICKVPIGLDTDTLQVYYLPMEQAPAFILGNAKTGKTNVIKNMLTLLSDERCMYLTIRVMHLPLTSQKKMWFMQEIRVLLLHP